ncbi:hypothetical protein ACI2KR_28930 [Pseudomonas luteola]|uniref:hypothetical protein n=1 Tax=Pseudomonas sp. TaxID=306 RepID=UPI0028963DF2|nr:hypothetical protein [Pseudomonas sp.]
MSALEFGWYCTGIIGVLIFFYKLGRKSGIRSEEEHIIELKLRAGAKGLVEYSDYLRNSSKHIKRVDYLREQGYGDSKNWEVGVDERDQQR